MSNRIDGEHIRNLVDLYLNRAEKLFGIKLEVKTSWRLRKCMGRCSHYQGEYSISLNPKLIRALGDEYLTLVIPHEIAHLILIANSKLTNQYPVPRYNYGVHDSGFWAVAALMGEDFDKREAILPRAIEARDAK